MAGKVKEENLIGQKFGYLTVNSFSCRKQGTRKRRNILNFWICLCDCGNETEKSSEYLKSKRRKSCGCKSWIKENGVRDPKSPSHHALFSRMRGVGLHLGRSWELEYEEFIKIINSNCHYCQIPPSRTFNIYKTKKGIYRSRNKEWCDKAEIPYTGIDRIDSSKGYISGNVVPACPTCNWAKNDLPYEDFIKWIRNLVNVWKDKI